MGEKMDKYGKVANMHSGKNIISARMELIPLVGGIYVIDRAFEQIVARGI